MANTKTLSPLFWLWIPVAIAVAQIGIELFVPAQYLGALHSEGGPHETLQAIFMAAAFIVAIAILVRIKAQNIWLTLWVGIAALAAFYVTGEEISWGQHIFDWGTPDFWQQVNDQSETNLHNTSSWLDQKPRAVLLIGVIVGGLMMPLLARFKPSALPPQFSIIYPPAILTVTAICAVLVKVIDKGQDAADIVLLYRASEVEELYLFYFVLLYLIILRRRVMQ